MSERHGSANGPDSSEEKRWNMSDSKMLEHDIVSILFEVGEGWLSVLVLETVVCRLSATGIRLQGVRIIVVRQREISGRQLRNSFTGETKVLKFIFV
jgi:hypothetical protein